MPYGPGNRSTSFVALPVELHEHILSFLPFDTLFLASKVCQLWQEIFTSRFLSSRQYTPPYGYGIDGTHQLLYGTNADLMCLVQNAVVHKIYLQYDAGFKLDITNDPILSTKFLRSAEDRDAVYPCVPVKFHPTRVRRQRRKPNPYILPSPKGLRHQQIGVTILHLDQISEKDTIGRVVLDMARRHWCELPRRVSPNRYWMEVGPVIRSKPMAYRQGLEAFYRGGEP
ncbi:hypothetical protein TWF481_009903 [Arthrobotrys musiformis]|uniref:F-box domain-containing protein n=1 Tax=Arthrobotrys musiformis TaxID=47236 RepID=A0AAV9W568_9PEZI